MAARDLHSLINGGGITMLTLDHMRQMFGSLEPERFNGLAEHYPAHGEMWNELQEALSPSDYEWMRAIQQANLSPEQAADLYVQRMGEATTDDQRALTQAAFDKLVRYYGAESRTRFRERLGATSTTIAEAKETVVSILETDKATELESIDRLFTTVQGLSPLERQQLHVELERDGKSFQDLLDTAYGGKGEIQIKSVDREYVSTHVAEELVHLVGGAASGPWGFGIDERSEALKARTFDMEAEDLATALRIAASGTTTEQAAHFGVVIDGDFSKNRFGSQLPGILDKLTPHSEGLNARLHLARWQMMGRSPAEVGALLTEAGYSESDFVGRYDGHERPEFLSHLPSAGGGVINTDNPSYLTPDRTEPVPDSQYREQMHQHYRAQREEMARAIGSSDRMAVSELLRETPNIDWKYIVEKENLITFLQNAGVDPNHIATIEQQYID